MAFIKESNNMTQKKLFFKSKTFCIIVIFVLLAGSIFLGISNLQMRHKLQTSQLEKINYSSNQKILEFTESFIEKVLKNENEVDFETRLKLENMVRELDDRQILDNWNRFTASQTEDEAQTQVKNLLELLINKIQF